MKFSRRWELKLLLIGEPHNTFGSAKPTHHQVVIGWQLRPLSLPMCPRHTAANPTTWPQSRSSNYDLRCPGAKCTHGHLYAWTWCSLWRICDKHRSDNKTPNSFRTGGGGCSSESRPIRFYCRCQREHWSHPGGPGSEPTAMGSHITSLGWPYPEYQFDNINVCRYHAVHQLWNSKVLHIVIVKKVKLCTVRTLART